VRGEAHEVQDVDALNAIDARVIDDGKLTGAIVIEAKLITIIGAEDIDNVNKSVGGAAEEELVDEGAARHVSDHTAYQLQRSRGHFTID